MSDLGRRPLALIASPAIAWILVAGVALADDPTTTEFPIDLDGNGAESLVQLYRSANTGGDASPNVVCVALINNADGEAYAFEWPNAGPGGFRGRTGLGSSAGSGVVWRWDTLGNVCGNPCVGDQCLSVANVEDLNVPIPIPPFPGLTTSVCNGGVNLGKACIIASDCPGAACGPCGDVTHVSEASLVSSLHQFFGASQGPGKARQNVIGLAELLHFESKVQPAAGGGFLTRTLVVNLSANVVGFEVADGGAFAGLACGPGQLNCGDVCCEGASCSLQLCGGLQCSPPSEGDCVPPGIVCGDTCVNPLFDEQHCGGCAGAGRFPCGPGECCLGGTCEPCRSERASVVLRPGEQVEVCQGSAHPAREVLSKVTAFCDPTDGRACSIDGGDTRGMINVLVPDPSVILPANAPFLTVQDVQITDPDADGNGLAQPGETVQLTVSLLNAGAVGLPANAKAMLYSVDSICSGGSNFGAACLTDAECPDGGTCPVPIQPAVSTWVGGIGAGPGPGGPSPDCERPPGALPQAANDPPFDVTIPAAHSANTTRVFELSFDVCNGGTNAGEPCRDARDCPGSGVCDHICSDGAGTCTVSADCNLGASCIDASVGFPVGIRRNASSKAAEAEGCGRLFAPPLRLYVRPEVMVWSDVGEDYDIVGGDLGALHQNGWTNGVVTCLANDIGTSFVRLNKLCSVGINAGRTCADAADCNGSACAYPDGNAPIPDLPNDGDGYWFLVRDPTDGSYGNQNLLTNPPTMPERPIIACP